MARKARRYFPRRPAARTYPDDAERQGQVDAAARQLAGDRTLAELQALLANRAALLEEADHAGETQPGPMNLARFRRARADWEVAQRAVELASQERGPE